MQYKKELNDNYIWYTLQDTRGHVYPYPLISSYPVPRAYIPNLGARSTVKQGTIWYLNLNLIWSDI